MLRQISDFQGFAIAASDGAVGHVDDLLFDDDRWIVRWAVVQTGGWFDDRKVLLPPWVLGRADMAGRKFEVRLTRQQVKDSPNIDTDKSISRQMETNVYDHYGWTPYWGSGLYMGGAYIGDPIEPPVMDAAPGRARDGADLSVPAGHLRSARAVVGYHIHASDGDIGHVQAILIEEEDWSVRYFVVETSNWWAGEKVLISPRSVRKIDWAERLVHVNVDRAKVKASPTFDAATAGDPNFHRRFNNYYASVIA